MSADIRLKQALGAFTLDVDFHFAAPGITALFGPSGAGKSSVIHAIAGLTRPEEGRIVFDGETLLDTERGIFLPAWARRIAVVFQDARLFPHLSVRTNLLYGRRRAPARDSQPTLEAVVDLLGIAGLLSRRPRGLSGGEKARVALGRALLAHPRALLLDEPLAALDTARKAEILPYLERLRDEAGIPMLYVSHSLDEVARLADRMIVLDHGRVASAGTVFDVAAKLDGSEAVRPLLGAILPAVVAAHDPQHGLTELAVGPARLRVPAVARAPGATVRIRIDAYDIMLARTEPAAISANNVLLVTVAAIRADAQGPYADIQLALDGHALAARITRYSLERLQIQPGDNVYAVIKTVTVGGGRDPERQVFYPAAPER